MKARKNIAIGHLVVDQFEDFLGCRFH